MIDLESEEPHWFCIKTKPRLESTAKRILVRDTGIDCRTLEPVVERGLGSPSQTALRWAAWGRRSRAIGMG